MPLAPDNRPEWLSFDCYGTLIQWDEGLKDMAVRVMKAKAADANPDKIVKSYDQHESDLERNSPFKPFHQVASTAFVSALGDLGVDATEEDGRALVEAIPRFIPFPETLATLATLKAGGFALISNTDDSLIAGSVAQLGGQVDQVFTAERARTYKPSRLIFDHALAALGISYDQMLHICASPALDHAAARDQRFRCVWINRGTYRKPLADYTADETLPTLNGLPDLFAKLGWMTNRPGQNVAPDFTQFLD